MLSMAKERVLSLDPGIGRTGYAVLEKDDRSIKPLTYGCIQTKSTESTEHRLQQIHLELTRIITKYRPEVMVMEKIFFNTNQKTAIVVGQAQGVMLLCAAENNLRMEQVTPLEIKMSLTGYGAAGKPQVQQMVMTLLSLKETPKPDDTADALACGLTYLSINKMLK